MVRLKHNERLRDYVLFFGFNSTMVRLKPRTFISNPQTTFSFQFHYGAIKTIIGKKLARRLNRFNSTMVRLKHGLPCQRLSRHARFQFHYGAIKTCEFFSHTHHSKTCFNSTMVRLKHIYNP